VCVFLLICIAHDCLDLSVFEKEAFNKQNSEYFVHFVKVTTLLLIVITFDFNYSLHLQDLIGSFNLDELKLYKNFYNGDINLLYKQLINNFNLLPCCLSYSLC